MNVPPDGRSTRYTTRAGIFGSGLMGLSRFIPIYHPHEERGVISAWTIQPRIRVEIEVAHHDGIDKFNEGHLLIPPVDSAFLRNFVLPVRFASLALATLGTLRCVLQYPREQPVKPGNHGNESQQESEDHERNPLSSAQNRQPSTGSTQKKCFPM